MRRRAIESDQLLAHVKEVPTFLAGAESAQGAHHAAQHSEQHSIVVPSPWHRDRWPPCTSH